ncbi:MAG: hypothetical protein R2939_09115 [Kofleriaceae bacterium]
MGRHLERSLAVLNGAVGDYLARTGNGLATPTTLVRDGVVTRRAPVDAGPRPVVLVHGLMGTEADWRAPSGADLGAALARDLGLTPHYVRYNSGQAIVDSGRQLAALLEEVVDTYPVAVDELVLIGHSLGGLVVRAACGVARADGHRWLGHVRRAIYLGTPHRGAPLERVGRGVVRLLGVVPDPVTRLVGEIAAQRSVGIRDLGARAHPAPLLDGIAHHLIAGSLAGSRWLAALLGDGMVTVDSATDGRAGDDDRVVVVPGVGHVGLLRDPRVYALVRGWCEVTP